MRTTPEHITTLEDYQIFVFGSNEAGRHGAGAAKMALRWGAVMGKPEGIQGRTYAIPTKDKNIKTIPIKEIQPYVHSFIQFSEMFPDLVFMVTEIGCGLAGMTPDQIAPLFEDAVKIDNIWLPKRFWDVLNK